MKIAWLATVFAVAACGQAKNVIVYQEPGRFGGWPANHGIWSWGNEIVVGIRSAHFKRMDVGHAVDRDKPQEEWQARSLDGGETWRIEKPPELRRPEDGGPQPVDSPGGIDFTHPDFAMMFRRSGTDRAARFYYSTDRCRTWKGPFKLPLFGAPGIDARTDYLVNGKHEALVFLTALKTNGREGRVFCTRTTDGGKSWQFVSWIGPEPQGFSIMPSSVRLSPSRILTTLRRKEGPEHWIDAYVTDDNGTTWQFLNKPAPSTGGSVGNPPSMIRLKDGRLAITYGYRSAPFGIRARLSSDEGRNWGQEIILRSDGGCWDLGYPRTVQRPDGKLVTVYYYNDHPDRERYIGATIWDPVSMQHVVVYQEAGRFGGWPANNGIWSWGDEILVGFIQGYFKNVERGHAIDPQKPSVTRLARSLDGGRTWRMEPHSFPESEPVDPPGGLDFTRPDSAVALRMISSQRGYSRFLYSNDRGKTWQGPYKLPTYDQKVVSARTDYIVNGKHDLTAFLTTSKQNGREGRPLSVRTTDGGKTWDFVSWIGPEPEGFAIMPSSVRLSATRILTSIRRKEGPEHWIDAWVTDDNGKRWQYLNRPAPSTGGSVGNPPSMIKLRDGRLCLTYGYRSEPYGIRARLSKDDGLSWGQEILLRGDGGCWDLGYPRTVQRSDGKIVTVYYFNDHQDQERYIAATIWDP